MIAFRLALGQTRDQADRLELTGRIDGKNPTHWLRLEELDRRLGMGGGHFVNNSPMAT